MLFEGISALSIFISLVVSSILPYALLSAGATRRKRGAFLLSLCNCVACGIFLSTCFLGLIPHVRHHEGLLQKAYANTTGSSHGEHVFLNTEVVVLAGFVVILLIEQAIFTCSATGNSHSHGSPNRAHGEHGLLHDGDVGMPLVLHPFDDEEDHDGGDIVFRKEGTPDHHAHTHVSSGHSHTVHLEDGLTVRTLLLLLGLSIHSVFEGVALGLQKDRGDFVKIMIAIMLHEVLCCVAFGVSLAGQAAPRRSAIISTIILAACIPAGMCTAFVVDIFDSADSLLLRFVLEGLAAGTFIYVAASEMLPSELGHTHGKEGLLKSVAVAVGVIIFFVLQNFIGHTHGA